MRNLRHAACKGVSQMFSRKVFTSITFALALVVMGSSGCSSNIESGVVDHAADRLEVSAAELRVTERSELSTGEHRVFRVSQKKGGASILVVTTPDGRVLTDTKSANAFGVLAAAEKVAERFEFLGGARVAGWYGALGGGSVCGEVFDDGKTYGVATQNLADGARRVSYRFLGKNGPKRCNLVIAPDGSVRDVAAMDAPVAKRS
jgi:hypothetical protein